jgi:hypothetical protein
LIRIGLIDGALPPDWPGLSGESKFCEADDAGFAGGHAIAMAQTIQAHAADVEVWNAVVFPGRLATSLESVRDALMWLGEDPPEIVLCAFGMTRASVELAVAVSRLQRSGTVVVASAPARGDATVYPAALHGVITVQGDARCGPKELSRLDLPHATFGACPRAAGTGNICGASPAAAHVAGLLAHELKAKAGPASICLEPHVRFRGRERRGGRFTCADI